MPIPYRGLLKNVVQLGAGDLAGRLYSVATAVLLGHRYGVAVLGVYALAQSLNQYLQPLIDFGLRHVGARVLALYPAAGRAIVERVQRRRLGMAAAALPLLLAYSLSARVPAPSKMFLFAFSTMGALYAVSLDWAAWGQGELAVVSGTRTVVPLSIFVFLALGRSPGERVLWWAVAGNACGYLLQGAIFWSWWKRQPRRVAAAETLAAAGEALAWRRTSLMGLAWFCNLAFNSIDLLMLGLMSNPEQVGLYGAAYRVLNQVLSTYYLLTYVLYPRLAQQAAGERARMLRAPILLGLAGGGIVLAIPVWLSRRVALTALFGQPFAAAAPLLAVLAASIPLDFLTSYLSNAYIAWGMEKKVLACTAAAALGNVLLNLASIPAYGAGAAAVNTLLSYAIFLACLAWAGGTEKALARRSRHRSSERDAGSDPGHDSESAAAACP
jgi:O-antigen/teichoic acid export membrane protein